MEWKIARDFNEKVQTLIAEVSQRETLYCALRAYQRGHDLKQLILDLKKIINEPSLITLYDDVRRLVPLKHQIQYDRLVPRTPTDKLRVVHLHRKNNEGLGFAVRGGLEHGVGIYVSRVLLDSQAAAEGLRVGDEIVRLNGFTINQAIHDEVLNLIKSKNELILKVRNIGMIPVREKPSEKLSWKYVGTASSENALQQVLDSDLNKLGAGLDGEEVKLFINLPINIGLGCSVCSGPPQLPGIFIQSIRADSLAVEAGLEVADQIISCNDTSFFNISHSQAVVALKGSRQLNMVIKKGAGGEFFGVRKRLLSEEEDRAMQFQLLVTEKQREKTGKMEKYKKNYPNKGKSSKKGKEDNPEVWESEGINYSQEDLIQQALTVLDEKDREKADLARETQSSPTSAEVGDAQKELIVHQRQPSVKQQTTVSPIYMSEERAPSFRLQKPVMLHPSSKSSKHSVGSSIAEEQLPFEEFTEDSFNPHRIFTNEQIAGRQIKLVNIRKDGSRDLGMIIESTGPGGRIMVAEVYEGGAIHKQGGIHVGDELMMTDLVSLLDVTVDDAQGILRENFYSDRAVLQLVIAKAPPSDLGEEVLPRPDYYGDIPISNLDDYINDLMDDALEDVPVTII